MKVIDETRIELSQGKVFPQVILLCILPPIYLKISYDYLILNKHLSYAEELFYNFIILVSIIYLVMCAINLTKIFSKKKAGVILNNLGVIDNCSSNPVGFMPWTDILSITISKSRKSSQHKLIINVKEPQQYIESGSTYRQIFISANWLQVNFTELVTIFKQYLVKYGQSELAEPWDVIEDV
jgi:hypothetical protein